MLYPFHHILLQPNYTVSREGAILSVIAAFTLLLLQLGRGVEDQSERSQDD